MTSEALETETVTGLAKRRAGMALALGRIAGGLEARPWLAFGLLLVVVVPAILGRSLAMPLRHDELFTFYIAQAPSVVAMIRETRLIDLNPPLPYYLTRASFAVFGVGTLAARLPEIVGFLMAMATVFAFVRRRAGTLYGLLAAGLLFSGFAGQLAFAARPYGLLLGFAGLSLLGWQRARAQERFGLAMMVAGGFGMLLNHVFGVYVWAALAAAEGFRALRERRVEWRLIVVWALPLISVATYVPLLRSHAVGMYPAAFIPGFGTIVDFYSDALQRELISVFATSVLMLLLVGRQVLAGKSGWLLTPVEWVSLGLLAVIPVVLMMQLMRSHGAFFERYGVAGNLAISVMAAVLLARWLGQDGRAALVGLGIALAISGSFRDAVDGVVRRHVLTASEPPVTPCAACAEATRLDPALPFVDASGLVFLEMDHRESAAMVSRVFYLTDPVASAEYAHANVFEGMALEKTLFPIRANVAGYGAFVAQHRHFFVLGDYGYPEDWLLRKLKADGATMRLLGQFDGSYKDRDLYEISF